jgi:hypothetical protein
MAFSPVSCTSPLVLILRPPKLKVTPQVTPYASNGGVSIVFAQFDLLNFEPHRAAPVLHRHVERNVGAHRLVVFLDLAQAVLRVNALELRHQFLQRIGPRLGHAFDAVLVAQYRDDLGIEDLPREHAGLLQHHAPVFGVGVVAEIRPLIDEALTAGVHHDAPRIAVLLEAVADREIPEGRGVEIPAHGMAAGPVAPRHRPDVERHLDAEPGVVTGAAHLGEVPARAEIARAHLGVRFEPAAGEHHGPGTDLDLPALVLCLNAQHAPVIVGEQRDRGRFVEDPDALALARLVLVLHEAGAPAPGLGRKPAPELVALVVDLVRLAAIARLELYALLAQPHQGLEAARNQELAQVGIGAVLRDAAHVVEVIVRGVGAEIVGLLFFLGEIGDELRQIVHPVVHHPHDAGGVAAVAAAFLKRGGLQHDDAHAALARGERRAGGGVAGADHDDIGIAENVCAHCCPLR